MTALAIYSVNVSFMVNEFVYLNKNVSTLNVKVFAHFGNFTLCNIQKLALKLDILCDVHINWPLTHSIPYPTWSSDSDEKKKKSQ